jgi:UDP-N-acetylmuramoyl-tripeptide--D-alanyl-D-alanine ligase
MREISIGEIAAAVNGKVLFGASDTRVSKVSFDSRKLEQGSLFIPLRGERFDGHEFLEHAVKRGAKALLVDRDGDFCFKGVSVIKVEDTLTAFHSLARWYRNLFHVEFVAVTGSTGKTTTKNIIASVLGSRCPVLKTPGNYNNQIGLPATIMSLDESFGAAVIEMGMSGFGEIRSLMKIVRPRVSVITNIGMSHIEKLGSREGILRAKMEVFEGMAPNPAAVINADDPLLYKASKDLNIPVVFFGLGKGDYVATEISAAGENGTSFTLLAEGGRFLVDLSLPGRHNVYNSLAAIVVGRLFGISFEEIIKALGELEGEKMRLAIVTSPSGVKVINDAYNASPDSMKGALEVLRDVPGERKVAVLSDMLEMGEYAEEGHRLVGEYAALGGTDILIAVGKASRFIALEAKERGMDSNSIHYFESKEEAAELLDCIIRKEDVILVKGSRGMKMEELVNRILERS